jgi:DNA-binding CsgD family transcriptional regulator
MRNMTRLIVIYGLSLAAIALGLEWLQFRLTVRTLDANLYAVCISIIFTGIGIWVGSKLTRRRAPFQPNVQALRSLKISARESSVLELLAAGHSNKEIARLLEIAPNTVKTHVASVLAKFEVTRRTQAIQKARELQILP